MKDFKDYSLPVKYRPNTFEEIIGNESVIEALTSCLERKTGLPHTFLFQGPSGCGKTTLARITANKLGGEDVDLKEYNISKMRGIDTAREIIDNCKYAPLRSKVKVFILNECHKATNEFENAMLEILEEPPKHVFFILVTTDPDKLLKTIKTRCTTFQVSSLQTAKIMKLLRYVCAQEKVEISVPLLQKISEYSDGSPRQALSILDKVIDIEDEASAFQVLLDSTVNEVTVLELCQTLVKPKVSWEKIAVILKKIDEEPEKIRYAVLSYMTKVLLDKASDRIANIIDLFSESWIYSGKAGMINSCYLVSKID